jgi:hypothetical protein
LKWILERRWNAVKADNMATINENVRNYWMAMAMATAVMPVMPVVAEEVALEEEEDLLAQTLAERWGEMGDSYWEAKAAEWDNHKFGLCFRCNCGLDDRADFVNCNYDTYTRLFCNDCFSRMV